MQLLDHFGLLAPFYDRIFAGYDPARLHAFLALPARHLLDVGGGTGRISAALVDQVELVVVADASRPMLSASRAKHGLGQSRAKAERLPFPDASFDRVLVVDAFHHFSDHQTAADELLRVVAPGGRLVVEELNVERLPVKLIALGERLLLMGSHFYRPQTLARMFEARGGRVTMHLDDMTSMWMVAEKAGM